MRRLLALVLACLASPALTEVSVHVVDDTCTDALVMVIIEDVDPVGSRAWRRHSDGDHPGAVVINPSGEPRGDRMPDLVFDPKACVVQIIWPFQAGPNNFDVAFARIVNGVMGPTQFLASGPKSELDARLFAAPDGTLHAVWWTPSPQDTVFMRTLPADSDLWEDTKQVSGPGEGARRPAVAVFDGALYVAYERDSDLPGFDQEVVVARRQAGGAFLHEVVARTSRTERLDPILHVDRGRLWLDWKHDGDALAWVELEASGWTSPVEEPWTNPSWVGVEETRRTIRRRLLFP